MGKEETQNEVILSDDDLVKMARGTEDRFYDCGLINIARGHASYVWKIPDYPGQDYTLTVYELVKGERKVIAEKAGRGPLCVSLNQARELPESSLMSCRALIHGSLPRRPSSYTRMTLH